VSPSCDPEAQVWPPSKDRSSHTASPGAPSAMLPQAMSSPSEMCRTISRPETVTVAACRLPTASDGSRPSQ
jgi:hypothetical protein